MTGCLVKECPNKILSTTTLFNSHPYDPISFVQHLAVTDNQSIQWPMTLFQLLQHFVRNCPQNTHLCRHSAGISKSCPLHHKVIERALRVCIHKVLLHCHLLINLGFTADKIKVKSSVSKHNPGQLNCYSDFQQEYCHYYKSPRHQLLLWYVLFYAISVVVWIDLCNWL